MTRTPKSSGRLWLILLGIPPVGWLGLHLAPYTDFPKYITKAEHMKPEHQYYHDVNSKDGSYYRRWAASYVTELLSEGYDELWTMLAISGGGSDDIVAVALSQVGNVGGEPYWSWYGFSSRVSWCACFASWCADQCGYIESSVMPKFSYCDAGIAWFKSWGQWQSRGYCPCPGDIIFFDWNNNGVADHVGIVESCDGSYVYTIEGSANDAVKRLSYSLSHWGIAGYGPLVD